MELAWVIFPAASSSSSWRVIPLVCSVRRDCASPKPRLTWIKPKLITPATSLEVHFLPTRRLTWSPSNRCHYNAETVRLLEILSVLLRVGSMLSITPLEFGHFGTL